MNDAVSRETAAKLALYARLVKAENERQNLVSKASLEHFAERHVADAAQLADLAPRGATWCDVGSGAGLPGLVIAIITGDPMTLVEPRALRCEFLRRAVEALALANVTVDQARAEQVGGRFDVITARAVAGLDKLLAMTAHLAHPGTRWILPKGRTAQKELAAAREAWQGDFALVPSKTSADAMIVVAERVKRRGAR